MKEEICVICQQCVRVVKSKKRAFCPIKVFQKGNLQMNSITLGIGYRREDIDTEKRL